MNIATRKIEEALEMLANAATLLENLEASGVAATYLIDEAQGDIAAARSHADEGAQRLAAILYN